MADDDIRMVPVGQIPVMGDESGSLLVSNDGTRMAQAVDVRVAKYATGATLEADPSIVRDAVQKEVDTRELVTEDSEKLNQVSASQMAWATPDVNGYSALGVDEVGTTHMVAMNVAGVEMLPVATPLYVGQIVTDVDGFVSNGARADGLTTALLDPLSIGWVAANLDTSGSGTAFEAAPVTLLGHSWFANSTYTTAGSRAHERALGLLRSGAVTNLAVSGRTIGDIANLALGGANAPTVPQRQIVSAICTINDITSFGTNLAAALVGYRHAWRALLSIATSAGKAAANSSAWAFSAGWTGVTRTATAATAATTVRNSTGGKWAAASTIGAQAQAAFNGPSLDLEFITATGAGSGGLMTIAVDGTTVGTLDLTASTAQQVPAVFRIRNAGAGLHTATVTLTSGGGVILDSYRIPSDAPPSVLVFGEPTVFPAQGDAAGNAATLAAWKAELAAVVAEFPTATYVDLAAPEWVPAAFADDGKHPNDRGASIWAKRWVQAAKTLAFRNGSNFLSASGYPAVPSIPALTPPSGFTSGTAL